MGATYTVTGMVLSAQPVGEYDKRIVILTREKGKISAFARGARRPGNSQMAGSRPFSFGEFDLFEGRSSYTVEAMRIKNYFDELSADLEGTMYGCYFMEFADYYARENVEALDILKLLYQSLRALTKEALSNELVRRIFELKLMTINGEYPNVFSCMSCGVENKNFKYFDFEKNGFICEECVKGFPQVIQLTEATSYTLQYIITSTIEKLYTFTLKEEVLKELGNVVDEEIKRFVDRKIKSLDILKAFIC